jgi:deoxyxylulose-5-phosphate synthase
MREAQLKATPCAIRYPSGSQIDAIEKKFYSDGGFDNIGIKCDFDENDEPLALIVTHGRIAMEAIRAQEQLAQEGIKVGIALLEILKPYDLSADLVYSCIPKNTKALLFLEEEIRSGGAGMNLVDKLSEKLAKRSIKYGIVAVDDDFVAKSEKGKTIYETAGIDARAIAENIKKMI